MTKTPLPTRVEARVQIACPWLQYVGNGHLWVKFGVNRKCPDFVLPGHQIAVEVFSRTMKAPATLKEQYAAIGWHCVIVREHELETQSDREIDLTIREQLPEELREVGFPAAPPAPWDSGRYRICVYMHRDLHRQLKATLIARGQSVSGWLVEEAERLVSPT